MAPAVASVAVKGPVAFTCSRYSHLDSGHYYFELVVLASACPGVVGVYPRLLLEEFQLSLGDSARAVRTWGVRLLHAALVRLGRALVMRQPPECF